MECFSGELAVFLADLCFESPGGWGGQVMKIRTISKPNSRISFNTNNVERLQARNAQASTMNSHVLGKIVYHETTQFSAATVVE